MYLFLNLQNGYMVNKYVSWLHFPPCATVFWYEMEGENRLLRQTIQSRLHHPQIQPLCSLIGTFVALRPLEKVGQDECFW